MRESLITEKIAMDTHIIRDGIFRNLKRRISNLDNLKKRSPRRRATERRMRTKRTKIWPKRQTRSPSVRQQKSPTRLPKRLVRRPKSSPSRMPIRN